MDRYIETTPERLLGPRLLPPPLLLRWEDTRRRHNAKIQGEDTTGRHNGKTCHEIINKATYDELQINNALLNGSEYSNAIAEHPSL